MKGGYKIIDFKNVSLSGTPVTMTDVLVDLLNNYEKVVLLSHVVLSGSAKDDCFSTVLSDGEGGVKLNCYDGYISINSSGAVTYTGASASGMASDIAELTAEIGDLDDLETTDKESIVGAINEIIPKYRIETYNMNVTENEEAIIVITPPTGFSKGVFLGISGGGSWSAVTVLSIATAGTDYPNRLKVISSQTQNVSAKIMFIK